MNHHKGTRKFGRRSSVRKALLKSLALSLVVHGKIMTTDAKARELRPYVEKMITMGGLSTVASRRQLASKLGNLGAKKVSIELSPRYKDRKGGYTRITKLPRRLSDGSLMSVIEFV